MASCTLLHNANREHNDLGALTREELSFADGRT
jgi:hypothetical protein